MQTLFVSSPPVFTWHSTLDGRLRLAAGSCCTSEPVRVSRPVPEGVQIIVALDCDVHAQAFGQHMHAHGSGVYLVQSSGQHEAEDCYAPAHLQRHVRLGWSAQGADMLELDVSRLQQQCDLPWCMQHGTALRVLALPLTAPVRTLALHMVLCPYQGALRTLFLHARSLELTAAVCHAQPARHSPASQGVPLSVTDTERLMHARDLIRAHVERPLSLGALAQAVGMHERRLTQGFRLLFGTTVFAHVRQQRLEYAWSLLASGYTVTQAALHSGYSIAHFSVAFRRHFGVTPQEVRRD